MLVPAYMIIGIWFDCHSSHRENQQITWRASVHLGLIWSTHHIDSGYSMCQALNKTSGVSNKSHNHAKIRQCAKQNVDADWVCQRPMSVHVHIPWSCLVVHSFLVNPDVPGKSPRYITFWFITLDNIYLISQGVTPTDFWILTFHHITIKPKAYYNNILILKQNDIPMLFPSCASFPYTAVARNMCNWRNYDFIEMICVTSLAGAISSLLYLLKAISDLVGLKAE